MTKEFLDCIPCRRKQNELLQSIGVYRTQTKKRAIEAGKNMVIWLDTEEAKWRSTDYDTAINRGVDIFEIISKYP